MTLTGSTLIDLLTAGAIMLAIAAAVLRTRHHTAAAVLIVLVSLASGTGAALAAANREVLMYPSWSSLVGQQSAAGSQPGLKHIVSVHRDSTGSAVTEYAVPGPEAHLVRSLFIYTPPGYDTAVGAALRYPVIQLFNGFPGGPQTWLDRLQLQHYLDAEIQAGRMAPTIAVLADQNVKPTRDSECVNAVDGPAWDTWLSRTVVNDVKHRYRVIDAATSWGTLGYSTGGFCAANIAYRHPGTYSAAASLSGYFSPYTDRTTGDLYHGDKAAYHANDIRWEIVHRPDAIPHLPLYAAAGGGDHEAKRAIEALLAVSRAPLQVTPAVLRSGGHSMAVWQTLEPAALDWLSEHIGGPRASGRGVG